jgi:hypothetical protein
MVFSVMSREAGCDKLVNEGNFNSHREAMAYIIMQLALIVGDNIAIGDLHAIDNTISVYLPELETRLIYSIVR